VEIEQSALGNKACGGTATFAEAFATPANIGVAVVTQHTGVAVAGSLG
jgi:hypothetical protein